jgi:hypothetical protein
LVLLTAFILLADSVCTETKQSSLWIAEEEEELRTFKVFITEILKKKVNHSFGDQVSLEE